MSNMTPSEIADWLTLGGEWAVAARDHEGAEKHHDAAATIRELEASNKARADIIYAQNKASEIDRAKLKIATEALEAIDSEPHRDPQAIAEQALAQIKGPTNDPA